MTIETLYKQYILARKYAWIRYDKLAGRGKTTQEIEADEEYRRLCKKQDQRYEIWRQARRVA